MGFFDFFKASPRLSADVIIASDKGEEAAKQKVRQEFDRGMTDEEYNKLRIDVYRPLAEAGDAHAQYWMGLLSVGKNTTQAVAWYEKAAEQGNTEAMLALANGYGEYGNEPYYKDGFGFDAAKERFWKLKAAESGNEQAKVDIALDYLIDGDVENALKQYRSASNSKDCKILIKAYAGLTKIYGNSAYPNYYDIKLYEDYLIRILEMKQNNPKNIRAYDETEYNAAASSLGYLYKKNYEATSNPIILKRYVYCFVLSYIASNNPYAKEEIMNSNYRIPQSEWKLWVEDAQTLSFHLPEANK